MQAGDRVQLKKDVANTFNKVWRTRPPRINWFSRTGEVVTISRVTDTVAVQWEDRKTLDHWPMRALMVVIPAAPPLAPD